MNLTTAQRDGFAREVACERIYEGAKLDAGDEFATEPAGKSGDRWVTLRVLVKNEDIEALARVRRMQARRSRRQSKRGGRR